MLKLKTAWRDGTTHLVMSPLEHTQRLVTLVPRPRLHLIRFHSGLAPNAKRALVVGELKIILAILERPVIEKILTHLKLQALAPPRAPARGQALQAEPGHKQSSRLFVSGEEPGHWPGAPCKRPDADQP